MGVEGFRSLGVWGLGFRVYGLLALGGFVVSWLLPKVGAGAVHEPEEINALLFREFLNLSSV